MTLLQCTSQKINVIVGGRHVGHSKGIQQRKCFIQNGYNSEAASEAYFNRYPERRQPNMSIFGRLKENLVEYGGFNKPRPKNYRIQDAEDVAINVVGMVVVNPSISSRQIEAESGISRRRALSVLKKHKFRPYTIRKQQQLLPTDPERRLDFCNWYLQQIEQDQLFFKNIIWTDESYAWNIPNSFRKDIRKENFWILHDDDDNASSHRATIVTEYSLKFSKI
ncbi:hypothetical protein NQ318_002894 [Aromia moschata]|uniref:Transposase Tc1-like domain-containing protein n=1 Tax=Aromia moschata TaxID=1265417 RepID=A0AAV8Y934_9CUCU|nr:hypothetical protein NQ318_002894 [Aromia moschata]